MSSVLSLGAQPIAASKMPNIKFLTHLIDNHHLPNVHFGDGSFAKDIDIKAYAQAHLQPHQRAETSNGAKGQPLSFPPYILKASISG